MEQDSVENLLLCLQLIYFEDEISNHTRAVRDCLPKTVTCLSRQSFFSKIYIEDMAAVAVGKVRGDGFDTVDFSESHASIREKPRSVSPELVEVANIETDNLVFHGATFWEVFDKFINMDPKCPSFNVATILIIGSEGMGKTHACYQMACRAQPECFGTSTAARMLSRLCEINRWFLIYSSIQMSSHSTSAAFGSSSSFNRWIRGFPCVDNRIS
jgi:hypothetical protein